VRRAIAKKTDLMHMAKKSVANCSDCEYQQKYDAETSLMVAKLLLREDVVEVGEAVLGDEANSGRIAPCQLIHIFLV